MDYAVCHGGPLWMYGRNTGMNSSVASLVGMSGTPAVSTTSKSPLIAPKGGTQIPTSFINEVKPSVQIIDIEEGELGKTNNNNA